MKKDTEFGEALIGIVAFAWLGGAFMIPIVFIAMCIKFMMWIF
jgi:hypothetical protein